MAETSRDSAKFVSSKKALKGGLTTARPKNIPHAICKHVASFKSSTLHSGAALDALYFLLKIAALEAVRRISRARCPIVWNTLQALQCLCYPPLKWIQKWLPLQGLINGMQKLSRPLLVLSIASALSNELKRETSHNRHSQSLSVSPAEPSQHPSDTRTNAISPQQSESEEWLVQLYQELENQGISLPERLNEDELRRYYAIANGDFTSFLSSIKKTIHWRETYRILSEDELEAWSDLVFWHGYDLKHQPCLVVRLGNACLKLPPKERPCFSQAVVSQVEHGVLHLLNPENPKIMVLVDCEGLSPLRIPMQVLRSCSSILQDHFPNRLGCLFVVRLPPVARVIAQTFIQVLRPNTRKKLRFEGERYRRVLYELLETLPSCLGGDCNCLRCFKITNYAMQRASSNWRNRIDKGAEFSRSEETYATDIAFDDDMGVEVRFDQVLRMAIISVLMVWLFVALIMGLHDSESNQLF